MSTSLLYNKFGIRGYHYQRTDDFQGPASFVVEQGAIQDVAHRLQVTRTIRPTAIHVFG